METNYLDKISLKDEAIWSTLSDLGIYISNYITGDCLSSHVWSVYEHRFDANGNNEELLRSVHEEDRARIGQALDDVIQGKSHLFQQTYRIITPSGKVRWIQSLGKSAKMGRDGRPQLFIGYDTDITQHKEKESELRALMERISRHAREQETIRQIVSVVNETLDMEQSVQLILEQLKLIIPYDTGTVQLFKGNCLQIIGTIGFSKETEDQVKKLTFDYPVQGSLSTHALKHKMPTMTNDIPRDFTSFIQPEESKTILSWIGIPLIARGEIIGLLALDGHQNNHFQDHHLELAEIIGRHIAIALDNTMLHEKAYRLAMEDALTGLGNRHRLQLEGRLMYEAGLRNRAYLSVIMVDIDNFKRVNDTFGHDVGDLLLQRIASIIQDESRSMEIAVRYGGEEMLLLMPETNSRDAYFAAERIRKKVQSLHHEEIGTHVTVSLGIASMLPSAKHNINTLITRADKQLYRAKNEGKNLTCLEEFALSG